MANLKLNLTRDQLALFLKDHESIKQFERLFATVDAIAPDFANEVAISAGTAQATANDALALISALSSQTEFLALAPPDLGGTVTSVGLSGGTTGLTATSSTTNPITTSGTFTLGGTLVAVNGGTGLSSYAVGDILFASTTTALSKLADVATGDALISGGVGVAPAWGKIGLTTHVSGTLPVANGGTGTATAFTAGSVVFAGASGVYTQDNAGLSFDSTTNKLTTGEITANNAWDAANGGGQLYLSGATGNRIDFSTAGGAAPSFTTRSVGTKICLYPQVGAAAVDYAFGIAGSTLWSSVPTSAQFFRWYAGTTQVGELAGTGNFSVTGTVATDGVVFPATQVASANANTLDDYEEGTWTPRVYGLTTAGTGTYSIRVAQYTKIGRLVNFQFRVAWTAHTGTGSMRIDGLPFLAQNTTNLYGVATIGYADDITSYTAAATPMAIVPGNTDEVRLYEMPSGGGAIANIAMTTIGDFIIGGSYYT